MSLRRFLPLCLLLPTLSFGQYGRGQYTTFGADQQRTNWNRSETEITPDSVKTLKLEWSLKLDIEPKALHGLTPPVARAYVATPHGIKDLVAVGASNDKLFLIDADAGKIYWQKAFTIDAKPQRGESWLCPNAVTATPVFGQAPAGAPGGQAVYALASDGKLHAYNVVNGEEVMSPVQLAPPFTKMWSLNIARGVIYTATSQGCNGANNGVFSMDLTDKSHKVNFFQTGQSGSGVWGRGGPAVTSDGKAIVETGDGPYDPSKNLFSDSVIALSKDMQLIDYFTPPNRAWITKKDLDMGAIGPTIFNFKGRELAAASGKEGVIFLLDTKSLGGADHRTPLYRSPMFTNEEVNFIGKGFWGGFSTWEDPSGTRWLYGPAMGPPVTGTKFQFSYGDTPNGSVMAFKVEDKEGKPVLTPVWNSVNMRVPTPGIIANGVIMVLADGDNPAQFTNSGGLYSIEERRAMAGTATLYALDALTGKTLWSSGNAIKGFSHFNGIALAGGRIYVPTFDGTLYCFSQGSPMAGEK